MKLFTTFLISCISLLANAGEGKYPFSSIPIPLLKDANAVKRLEQLDCEIVGEKQTRVQYTYVITILNENGDDYAEFSEWYDQLRHIESIEGYLYDKEGKLVKKVKTKDLQDRSAVDDNSLMDDNRVKTHNFYYKSYPYTVEYQVSLTMDQTFSLPTWFPQDHRHMTVEKSIFNVLADSDYKLRYKNVNYTQPPVQTPEKSRIRYTWQVSNLDAVKGDPYGPRWQERCPRVLIAPSKFQLGGYKGDMSDWSAFGKFMFELNKDRDQLPDAMKLKVKELTAGLKEDRDKIQALYKYMQQNTRYISVQLGIGGWQTFDAAYVAKKGYGDCKALSNYMHSLLKEAGIKSSYTLIRAGDFDTDMEEDFPSNQFNHAILCVPLAKDTLWLECTSQTVAAGYMGSFTGNRKALLVDENGGTLVATPRYGIGENVQVSKIRASIDLEGTLDMQVSTRYGGVQQDDLSALISHSSREEVKRSLQERLDLSTYEVSDFKYDQSSAGLPQVEEQLHVKASNYATASGKRLFIVPNILNKSSVVITEDENRKNDYVFLYAFHDEDDVEIEIPSGYEVEASPKETLLKTKYGSYTVSARLEGTKIHYHRIREQASGRYSIKEQADIAAYFKEIYKADRSRYVLVKK
ncbi:MAG TPA: DUF3857 domain-containing transglutaminase family protein [Flavisolibacter sp.]|jgi:hypothetical protein|nr:DUF3857 domain-containing transglutaminase family protein [Flavisolibacter sp.]